MSNEILIGSVNKGNEAFFIAEYLKKNNFFEPVNVGQSIDCYSEKIEDSVLNLSAKLKYIDAFISFNNIIRITSNKINNLIPNFRNTGAFQVNFINYWDKG